jgi:hypothetical protein
MFMRMMKALKDIVDKLRSFADQMLRGLGDVIVPRAQLMRVPATRVEPSHLIHAKRRSHHFSNPVGYQNRW